MNQIKHLWDQLSQHQLVEGSVPERLDRTPWYIQVMQGFAGWVAGLFLLGFFGVAFSELFFNNNVGLLLFIGFGCCGISYAMLRKSDSQFMVQLSLSIHLCGQILVAVGLFESYGEWFNAFPFVLLGLIQMLLGFIMNNIIHRFLSYLFGLISILFGLNILGIYGVGTALCAVLFAYLWMNEITLAKYRNVLEPLALSSGLAIIISTAFLLSNHSYLFFGKNVKISWMYIYAPTLSSICVAIIFLLILYRIIKEYKVESNTKAMVGILTGALALTVLSFKIIGLSVGVLLTLVGFYKQRLILVIFGLISMVLFFSWYYYSLNLTLLTKSIILISAGLIGLIAWLAVKTSFIERADSSQVAMIPFNAVKTTSLIVAMLVLGLINWNINKKETLLSEGQVVILKLAPVDPRSIMQGDYMRLRFEIQNQIRKHYDDLNKDISYKEKRERTLDGFALIELDQNHVAKFNGIANEGDSEMIKIPFRLRGFQVLLTTNAFYFQEGQAQHFQKAEYGEFKLSSEGEMILAHLLDEKFKRL